MHSDGISDNSKTMTSVLVAACLILMLVLWMLSTRLPAVATVTALDVGQGDATLIETMEGHAVLIDGGPDRRILAELGAALPPWKRSLDGVVLTHPDADHLAGLVSVLQEYDVGWVGMTGIVDDGQIYRTFLALLEEKNIPAVVLKKGDQIAFGEILLTVLAPDDVVGIDPVDTNTTSIVIVVSHRDGQHIALLMGDAERDVEYALLRGGLVPDVSLLKVGHHGSRFATSNAFLHATTPERAVVSAGANNRYGHPALTVLQRLAAVGAFVLTTAEEGTMELLLR